MQSNFLTETMTCVYNLRFKDDLIELTYLSISLFFQCLFGRFLTSADALYIQLLLLLLLLLFITLQVTINFDFVGLKYGRPKGIETHY